MAYSYYPNYQPAFYVPPYQQPMQQPQQPTQPQANSGPQGIIWVNGEKEAALFPVAPNNAVALWDSVTPAIYLKKADASGKPTMTTYDLVERQNEDAGGVISANANKCSYASKDDVEGLKLALAGINETTDGLKKDIARLKKRMEDDD